MAKHDENGFIEFAKEHPELKFLVTEIGCGIAGYTPEEIAPLFKGVPENVALPEAFNIKRCRLNSI